MSLRQRQGHGGGRRVPTPPYAVAIDGKRGWGWKREGVVVVVVVGSGMTG